MLIPERFRLAWAAAGLYVIAAAVLFGAHWYSLKTNPGDSGESAIPFFLLTLPWMLAVPEAMIRSAYWIWLSYPLAWVSVYLNAGLVYGLVRLITVACRWLWERVRGG